MLVKFMPKGRCGLDYCLGKNVRGVDPRRPEVLQGSPEQAAQVLKSLDFANPFTSVVLTYERKITAEEAARDIASFEAMLLPGMKAGLEYERVWIRHTEHPKDPATRQPDPEKPERTALHCIIPNVHLPTGKRLQPYFDRVDRSRVEAWQELTNEANGYASAKDPQRRRAAVLNVNKLPQRVADLKTALTEAVLSNVRAEQINNRDELTAWLKSQGFGIERTTKKSISVSHPTLKKNLRLEGELYELGGIESAASARDAGEIPPRRVGEIESDKYRRDLEEGLERKRAELQERFARRDEKGPRSLGGNDQGRAAEVGENSQAGRSQAERHAEEIHDLGERGRSPGRRDHGGPQHGPDLGEREQRDRSSLEQPATDRGREVGGSSRPGRGDTERSNGRTAEAGGAAGRDREAKAAASRSEGTGQSHNELSGEERGNLRGDSSQRPAVHLGSENTNSNQKQHQQLKPNYERGPDTLRHTAESLTNGKGLAGILAAIGHRARQTLDRVRAAVERANRAIRERFRFGPPDRERLARSARQVGRRIEDLNRASRGPADRGPEYESQLREGRVGVQFHEPELQAIGGRIGRDQASRKLIERGVKTLRGVKEIRTRDAREYGQDRGYSRGR